MQRLDDQIDRQRLLADGQRRVRDHGARTPTHMQGSTTSRRAKGRATPTPCRSTRRIVGSPEQVKWAVDHGDPLSTPGAGLLLPEYRLCDREHTHRVCERVPMADADRELGFSMHRASTPPISSRSRTFPPEPARGYRPVPRRSGHASVRIPSMDLYGGRVRRRTRPYPRRLRLHAPARRSSNNLVTLDTMLEEPDSATRGRRRGSSRGRTPTEQPAGRTQGLRGHGDVHMLPR